MSPLHATEDYARRMRVIGPLSGVQLGTPGEVTTSPLLMASVAVPDPGWPYRISALAHAEAGSMATGTRWNHLLSFWGKGAASPVLLSVFQKNEEVSWDAITTGGPIGHFRGPGTVRYVLARSYGSGSAMMSEFQRDLRVWLHPAGEMDHA